MIKINETLNTGKKKVLAFALSGALLLTLGSGVAYAASNINATAKADNGNGTIISDVETRAVSDDGVSVKGAITAKANADNGNGTISEDIEIRALSDEDGVSARAIARANADGTFSYSTDGGKTWSKEVPAGLEGMKDVFTAKAKADNGDGTISDYVETRAVSDDDGVSVKASVRANADGTLSYSTDGGKTWSKEVPAGLDGFNFSVNPDGNGATAKLGN